jgi:tetratricopeptide (TPR) repeat protein
MLKAHFKISITLKRIMGIALLVLLAVSASYAQSDILDAIEAELLKEQAAKKAADKAAKNKEKYDLNYRKEIGKADALFKAKKFDDAIAAYEAAKQWGPTETYPEEQIKIVKAEKVKAEAEAKIKQTEEAYNAAKTKAEAFMATKKYDEAIAAFGEALKAKPDETYPKTKIADAQKLKAKAEEEKKAAEESAKLNEAFAKAMAAGDAALKVKKWDEAIAGFEEAAKLKPAEAAPKARMAQAQASKDAEEKQKAQAELKKNFDATIATANDLLKQKRYDEAIAAYNEAHTLIPSDNLPKTKIAEAEAAKKADAEAAKRSEYTGIIKEADGLLKASEFDKAKELYTKALGLYPQETHPKNMLLEADKIKAQAAQNKTLNEYNSIIAEGETLLKAENFDGAVQKFEAAKKLLPVEKKADELIAEAARLKEQKANAAIEAEYQNAIKDGEVLMQSQKFDEAIAKFNEAHQIQPTETKTKELIAEANKLKSEMANALIKKQFEEIIKEAESLLTAGKFDEAIMGFKNAHEIMPHETKTKSLIAQAEKLKSEAKAKSQEEAAQQLLKEGDDLLATNEFDAAEQKYQLAKTTFSGISATADKKLSALQIAKKSYEETLRKQQQAEAAEEQYQKLMAEANGNIATGDFSAAIKAYEGAIILKPGDKQATAEKAEAQKLLENQNAEEARRKAEEDAKAEQQQKEVAVDEILAAARSLESNGQLYQARDKAKEALKIIGEHPATATYLDAIEKKINEEEKAKAAALAADEAAQKAEKEKQERIKTLLVEGAAAIQLKKFDQAQAAYQSALELDPSQKEALEKLTELEALKKRIANEEAAKAEEEAKKQQEAARNAQINEITSKGQKALRGKAWDEAISYFDEVLTIDPNNTGATKGKEEALAAKAAEAAAEEATKQAELQKAELEDKQRLEKERKEKISFLIGTSQTLEKSGQLQAAVEKLDEVLLLDAANPLAIAQKERINILIANQKEEQQQQQLAEEAKRREQEAKEAEKSKGAMIATSLGEANKLMADRKYQEAAGILESALQQYPGQKELEALLISAKDQQMKAETRKKLMAESAQNNEIRAMLSEALLAYNSKDFESAISKYQKVIAMDAENTEALNGKISSEEALAQQKEEQLKAQEIRAGMTEMERQVATIMDAGDDLFAGGKYEEAMTKYQEGLAIDPLNAELKKAVRAVKEAETMRRRVMLAKKNGKPRPRASFVTENIGGNTGERKDKIKFQNELGKRYPKGVTEEIDEMPRKTITRRIVVKNEIGREFMRIRHDWGGTYYFKDGESTSPFIWQLETRSPDGSN